MAIPLVMLGPGGDYQTRLEVRGSGLLKTGGHANTFDGEGESAGTNAGWTKLPKRAQTGKNAGKQSGAHSGGGGQSGAQSGGGGERIDSFIRAGHHRRRPAGQGPAAA